MKLILFPLLLLVGCASLEERLCNSTTAFQKGYDDVLNGRQGSPGLAEGEACKKSESYAYADYHRDYMAGFSKAKNVHCTQANATQLGASDAGNDKEFKSSLAKLAICIADESIKVNLENYYEIGYRKAFCQPTRAQTLGAKDGAGMNEPKGEEIFQLCAYEKVSLFKTYKNSYLVEIRKQCTAGKAGALGAMHARENKSLPTGLALFDRCPVDLAGTATQGYTAAYQVEKSNMREEERLKLERERMQREDAHQAELLRLRRQQLELEQQRLNRPPP